MNRHKESVTGLAGARSAACLPDVPVDADIAKDHGSSVKNDEQYEGLRTKG